MKDKTIAFDELAEKVLSQLKKQKYLDRTLKQYQRIYNRLGAFLAEKGINSYSPDAGREFLASIKPRFSVSSNYAHACAVRRLDDRFCGRPYRCHPSAAELQIPECHAKTLDDYLAWCEKAGNRPRTINGKKRDISLFLCFLDKNDCKDLCCLDVALISKALLIFTNKDGYLPVRNFLRFLAEKEITPADLSGIVPAFRRKKVLPTVYSTEEIARIEQAVDTSTETGRRDLAMIMLAARMGLRSGDIARLRLDEIDFPSGYLRIIQEKTLVPLTLQIPEEVIKALRDHLDRRSRSYKDGYVFHSRYAPYGRITTSIIRHSLDNCLKAAGIDISGRKHGLHALRSSLASSMVNDGASYETVRRILGHTDPDVIKHYAKSDLANLKLCAIDPPPPSGFFAEILSGRKEAGHV